MAQKDSMLDGFMKGLGKKLGTRRRDVHQAIKRFNQELNQDETPVPPKATPTPPAENVALTSAPTGSETSTQDDAKAAE